MKTYEATEQAYKNGYEKGYADGKRDAVKHGRWELDSETEISKYVYCTNCCQGFAFRKVAELQLDEMPYCPNCGAKMDGDRNG